MCVCVFVCLECVCVLVKVKCCYNFNNQMLIFNRAKVIKKKNKKEKKAQLSLESKSGRDFRFCSHHFPSHARRFLTHLNHDASPTPPPRCLPCSLLAAAIDLKIRLFALSRVVVNI